MGKAGVMENKKEKDEYPGIKAMPFVIGNETFEKLGTIGTSSNLLVYLTTVFNMHSISATNLVNLFNGTANFATIVGAFLCDTYFGRYNTLAFASISSFLGMLMLTMTAAVTKMHPQHCQPDSGDAGGGCSGPTAWQIGFLLIGFGFLVIGAGGIRPCNLAFGADQFNPKTETGKRGITSFFNWYYFTFTFAMMVSLTIIVYIQTNVSWAWGLAIPAFLMFSSCVMFFLGMKLYVVVKPDGSPLSRMLQVAVAAFRNRKVELPDDPSLSLHNHIPSTSINTKLPHTEQFSWLDKAAVVTSEHNINEDGTAADPWRLCSLQHVEEAKCLIRVLPIWVVNVIYFITLVQQSNYTVFQALQLDRRIGAANFQIPAGTYSVFSMISLTIWIPIYDRLIVPRLGKLTGEEGGITLLQKMGIGMFLAIMMMIVSAFVEDRRRSLAFTSPIGNDPKTGAISSLSGFWLVPQLVLGGLSESFTMISQVEFYYKQFPENMRSIGASLTFLGMACSTYMHSLIISIVHRTTRGKGGVGDWLSQDLNKGRLDYMFYVIAAIELVNLGYFIVCAKWYRYKGSDDRNVREIDMEKVEVSLEKVMF